MLGFQVWATAPVLLVRILNVYVHPETGQWFLSWTEPSWKRKWRALGLWLHKTLLEYTCRDSLPVSRPAAMSLCNPLGWGEVWCQRIVTSVERTDASPSGTLPGWMTPFKHLLLWCVPGLADADTRHHTPQWSNGIAEWGHKGATGRSRREGAARSQPVYSRCPKVTLDFRTVL